MASRSASSTACCSSVFSLAAALNELVAASSVSHSADINRCRTHRQPKTLCNSAGHSCLATTAIAQSCMPSTLIDRHVMHATSKNKQSRKEIHRTKQTRSISLHPLAACGAQLRPSPKVRRGSPLLFHPPLLGRLLALAVLVHPHQLAMPTQTFANFCAVLLELHHCSTSSKSSAIACAFNRASSGRFAYASACAGVNTKPANTQANP